MDDPLLNPPTPALLFLFFGSKRAHDIHCYLDKGNPYAQRPSRNKDLDAR